MKEVFGGGVVKKESLMDEWMGCFKVDGRDEAVRLCRICSCSEIRRCESMSTVELSEDACRNLGMGNVKSKTVYILKTF